MTVIQFARPHNQITHQRMGKRMTKEQRSHEFCMSISYLLHDEDLLIAKQRPMTVYN